jgi:hypothetical protein
VDLPVGVQRARQSEPEDFDEGYGGTVKVYPTNVGFLFEPVPEGPIGG